MGLGAKIVAALATLTSSEKKDHVKCWDAIGSVLDQLISPGMIQMCGKSTAPSGYLLCDGSAVSRTTYADLFAVIGETFGPGDGSTTFNLPDFRGIFPRGAGTNDTLGSVGGSVGDYQDFAIENITGSFDIRDASDRDIVTDTFGVFGKSNGNQASTVTINSIQRDRDTVTFNASNVVNTDSETRPANLSINFIIKT